ncbi:MAG: hypothetical protein JXQ65_01070 [Candidatus Marinimicrobia bacterium]|nr:hypothetical protein [Candidatus Neomarinimicrobiota bacterium]
MSFNAGKAQELYKKAYRADTSFAIVPLYMADVFYNNDEKDSAKIYLLKAYNLSKKASRFEKLIIENSYTRFMGNVEQAARIEDSLIAEFPDRLDVQARIAQKAFQTADYEKCREIYFQIIEKFSDYAMAYNMIGYSYALQGYYRDAQKYFEKYVAVAPNILNPYDSMAEFYMITGKYHETLKFLGELIDTRHHQFEQNKFLAAVIYLKIADAYKELGQFQKAVQHAEIARTYSDHVPGIHQINNFLFYLYFDFNDLENLEIEYDKIKDIIPRVESNFLKILLKIKQKNYTAAEKEIDDFCSKIQYKDKNYVKLVSILEGELAIAQEHYAVAADKFKTAAGITGDIYPAKIQNKYYISLGLDGKIDEAIEGLQNILKKNPNNPVSLINISRFYYEKDEINKAQHYMDHFLKLWENADPESSIMQQAMELKRNLEEY